MMSIRNHNSIGKTGDVNGARYREVPSPARTDGVGIALRHAFANNLVTDDFQGLLRELDHKTTS